ncbi:MAG: dihydroneopterin aldolase [Dysgonamonadaceae bacterium]|jgi:dihydroneopterin aldolase|nr:dihydroneopterin aldolase [Dysgonamonadaceae bacterium]
MVQYIELKGITCYAYHGVMEQERKVGNSYTIDLKLHTDFFQAMETDDVNDTINYAAVYEVVKKEMAIPSHLLEHVAGRIVRRLFNTFPAITNIEIRLAKRNPPLSGDIQEAAVCMQT